MCREYMPGITGISSMEECPTRSAEIYAGRVAVVGGHCFAQNEIIGIGLRQALGEKLPGLAPVAAARHTKLAFWNVPLFGRDDRNGEECIFLGCGNGQSKAEP